MDRTHAEAGKALDTQLQDLSKALKELDSKIDSKASSKEIHEVKEIQTRQQNQLDALEASVRAIHEKLDSIFGAAPEQEIIPQDERLITPPGPPTRPLSPDSPGTLRFGTPAPRFTSVRNGVSHVEPEQPQQAAAALDPSWNISREQLNVYLGPWKYEGKPGTLEEYARVQMLKVMSIGQRSRRATALPDCFVSTVEALGTNHKGKKLPVALTSKSTQPLQDSAGLDKAEMVAPSEMANRSTSSLDATTHEPEAIMRDERAEGASSSGENIVEESSSAPGEDFDLDDINMINGPTPKRHISDEHQILCSDTEGTNGGVEKTILNNTVPQKPTQSKRKPSPGPHSASSKRSKPDPASCLSGHTLEARPTDKGKED
ncbi:hypothetical protein M501DRAFT_762398 [Patellaria atrata CBS 101060]|uniref:Uncharacterized protein n=1 Tax=Patellaria atrata CBS 101060 TaxID=1346257 RepID=A0A9P4SAZ8_9PEZI|nr:hypothetical protein M501DRAFT_762398 [Patellaria atrata CBS 101060]